MLVTRRIEGISKTQIKDSAELPPDVLKLICRLADPYRFPWIAASRKPSARELRGATETTLTMHARSLYRRNGEDMAKLSNSALKRALSNSAL